MLIEGCALPGLRSEIRGTQESWVNWPRETRATRRLRGWVKTHPLVGDVRGRGLMIGIELVKDKATREPAPELRDRVETLAFERGLMMLGCGVSSLRLCPPLVVSKKEAGVALDIFEDALTVVEKEFAETDELQAAHA